MSRLLKLWLLVVRVVLRNKARIFHPINDRELTHFIRNNKGDLFPKQYIDALNQFADNLDPMPVAMSKSIIAQELLKDGERFEDVFSEFDEEPLGAASIAQVHRAVLSEKYGFREVAVKIQRPSIESKLMGDIANLKMIAKLFRDVDASPVDYYTIFSELENQLQDEFDFRKEAKAMDQIYNSLAIITSSDGLTTTTAELPIVMPRSVPELVTRRVLVMDFIRGVPLSRMQKKMENSGIKPGSMESKLFGRKFVESLTEVFGRNILETGLFHADPHPGNIMITDEGDIGLIDFGQVKQLTPSYRDTIAKIIIALDERKGGDDLESNEVMGKLILELGVELHKDAKPEAGAAIAMWLFDGSVENLPGGYDVGELSPDSPVKEIKEFPQDLVLIARSVVMIKAFSKRFHIRWSLAEKWAPIARKMLHGTSATPTSVDLSHHHPHQFFSGKVQNLKKRIKKRGANFAKRLLFRMPPRIRSSIASALLH
jgi:aarF domain-containing kinase